MRYSLHVALAALATSVLLLAQPAQAGLSIAVDGVDAGLPIPATQALCVPNADGTSDKVSPAMRPTIHWAGAPSGTASFAVFMMDPDVPADFTDAGKAGKIIAADAKRQDFYHWGVVELPATATAIAGGAASLPLGEGRALINDLGAAGYVPTANEYGGPCPPWNDARVHNYHFMVLALDKTAPVIGDKETAKEAFSRLITSPSLLDKAALVGTYTLNQKLRADEK